MGSSVKHYPDSVLVKLAAERFPGPELFACLWTCPICKGSANKLVSRAPAASSSLLIAGTHSLPPPFLSSTATEGVNFVGQGMDVSRWVECHTPTVPFPQYSGKEVSPQSSTFLQKTNTELWSFPATVNGYFQTSDPLVTYRYNCYHLKCFRPCLLHQACKLPNHIVGEDQSIMPGSPAFFLLMALGQLCQGLISCCTLLLEFLSSSESLLAMSGVTGSSVLSAEVFTMVMQGFMTQITQLFTESNHKMSQMHSHVLFIMFCIQSTQDPSSFWAIGHRDCLILNLLKVL